MTTRASHYRPSFDIHLTPKQRQGMAFMERGKTNFEIAQELGVSLEGAKYHVSEILAKLEVESREDAVRAWRDYNSTGARFRRSFAGFGAIPVLRMAFIAAGVVPVVFVAVVIAITRGGDPGPGAGGDGAAAIVTPTATVSASPAPTLATAVAAGSPTSAVTSPAATTAPASPTPGTGSPAPQQTTALYTYFMRGEAVGPILREVPATQGVARAALEQLLAGPTGADANSGLTSTVPAGTRLLSIAISNGVATVDLSSEFVSGGGSLSMRARLAQVVYTLTQFPTVDGVVFRIDGQETTVFGGEGVTLESPATRADFEDLTPAILLDSPAQGATVSSPARLRGTANTFEATFRITILDGSGRILAEEFATATSGTGTRGTFDVSVPFTVTAAGTGVIRVYESSARDGSPVNVVDVPVTLAP